MKREVKKMRCDFLYETGDRRLWRTLTLKGKALSALKLNAIIALPVCTLLSVELVGGNPDIPSHTAAVGALLLQALINGIAYIIAMTDPNDRGGANRCAPRRRAYGILEWALAVVMCFWLMASIILLSGISDSIGPQPPFMLPLTASLPFVALSLCLWFVAAAYRVERRHDRGSYECCAG